MEPFTPAPHLRTQERLLIDLVPELTGGRLLCNTAGRGQFAAEFTRQHPHSAINCWLLDLYQAEESRKAAPTAPNLVFQCVADPPDDEFDGVAWALSRRGDSELTRELLQIGHQRLTIGGRFAASIDNARDHWLQEQLQKLYDKVSRRGCEDGAVYLATKTAPLRKIKNYAAEFAFRDGQQLIRLRTRPGVFSHRELDGGARALIKAMHVEPKMRVLDLGCGCGAVGVAAALRAEGVKVSAIDSNPRAIESTLWAAERIGVEIAARLDCDGSSLGPGTFDLVLANPPYYSNFRLARLFVEIAMKALVHGGRALFVTKTPKWYADHLPPEFQEVTAQQVGHYAVVAAQKL
jgi:16S rRNA G1207 methylase RsmC